MNPKKTTNRRGGFQPNPKLRLREQGREVIRFQQFFLRVEPRRVKMSQAKPGQTAQDRLLVENEARSIRQADAKKDVL